MFKKILPAIMGLMLITGCYSTKAVTDSVNIFDPSGMAATGMWQMLVITEATTNFSSLLYDKTDAKYDTFTVRPIKLLPPGCKYYIMPGIYTDFNGVRSYDDTYIRLIASYLLINNYGSAVNDINEADFVILADIRESPERLTGKNTSSIMLTIMEKDETPVFFTRAEIYSNPDRNFYYRPSKSARPVKYLTLRGMERIFEEALPQAFG